MTTPPQRPFKPVNLQQETNHVFRLNDLVAAERETPSYSSAGRTGVTLVRTDGLTLLLVVIQQGVEIHDHKVRGAASITLHEGCVKFFMPETKEPAVLATGDSLILAPGVRHRVFAAEDSAFLIAIGAGVS